METTQFFEEAKALQSTLVTHRRYLHQNAEIGFDLPKTLSYVQTQLKALGYAVDTCGKAALLARLTAPNAQSGKQFLLRADMDALPIAEKTRLPFAAKNGNMHACGHDMHTAMLLGAAALLKHREQELCGNVTFLFQAAEETLEGAKDVLDSGAFKTQKPDAALMLHVLTASSLSTGTAIVAAPGPSAPAAEFFTIRVQGKGCHGSMPQEGVDALSACAHILIALQEISARELGMTEEALLTVGALRAGTAGNVIADSAEMKGSLRSFDTATQKRIKKRVQEIVSTVAKAFRAKAKVTFEGGAPALVNDAKLSAFALHCLQTKFGEKRILSTTSEAQKHSGGSEDFAYISQEFPSLLIALAAGNAQDGYAYPLHHPKTSFDESVLPMGSAIYAQVAFDWLRAHCQ